MVFTVQIEVGNPAEVDEIFDAISYCKGASIIRMLHNYIGDDVSSVFVCACVCVRSFVRAFMCLHSCVCVCVHACVSVCIIMCVCMCVCACIYVHA